MSHRGYGHESEVEDFFLRLTNQTKKDPILKADRDGLIRLNRTFRVPASGAMASLKGDIITSIPWLPKQFKIECKARRQRTKKDGQVILIEKEWIRKNEKEAEVDNQVPILCYSFKGVKTNRLWWIVEIDDFIEHLACIFYKELYSNSFSGFQGRKLEIVESMRTIKIKQNKTFKFVLKDLLKMQNTLNKKRPSYYRFSDTDNGNDYVLISHTCFKFFLDQLQDRIYE